MSGPQTTPTPPASAAGADPSMEDILASIRRILSEEDPSVTTPAAASNAVSPEAGEPDDGVLVLDVSMLVEEEAQPASDPQPEEPGLAAAPPHAETEPPPPDTADSREVPTPWSAGLGVLDTNDHALPFQTPPVPDMALFTALLSPSTLSDDPFPDEESPAMSIAQQAPEGIASPETTEAASSAVSSLVRAISADRGAQVSSGGPTIADLVREEIRPLLATWLDTHLPPLVERLVRAEIDRVVSRAGL